MLSKTDWKEIYWSIVYWSNSHVFTACTGGTSAPLFANWWNFVNELYEETTACLWQQLKLYLL